MNELNVLHVKPANVRTCVCLTAEELKAVLDKAMGGTDIADIEVRITADGVSFSTDRGPISSDIICQLLANYFKVYKVCSIRADGENIWIAYRHGRDIKTKEEFIESVMEKAGDDRQCLWWYIRDISLSGITANDFVSAYVALEQEFGEEDEMLAECAKNPPEEWDEIYLYGDAKAHIGDVRQKLEEQSAS